MRKLTALIMTLLLAIGLAACGSSADNEEADTTAASETAAEETAAEETAQDEAETLVVYFSATGTTKGVAEKIAAITGADLYEIKAAQEYTDADLDYNNSDNRATVEQNDPSARPEIGSDPISIDGYSTIYIGYPIWWGEEPRIMDTFVESYDFDGKNIIPFCTSGESSIDRSQQNLEENAGSGNWIKGTRLEGNISEDQLSGWVAELK